MRNFRLYALVATLALLFNSCNKDNKSDSNQTGGVQFSLSVKSLSAKKTASADGIAGYVMVSIEDNEGKPIYTSEKVEIINFNGTFKSKPLALSPGSYLLTEFFVLDAQGNVTHATPKKGSALAYLVKKPLSINFDVKNYEVTDLIPEVLSTEELSSAEFGYIETAFETVKTFDFRVSVFVFNESSQKQELASASVTVNDLYTLPLEAIDNKVKVNDGHSVYILKFSKSGYGTKILSFSNEELKKYSASPMIVVLLKNASNVLILQPNANEAKDAVIGLIIPDDNRGEAVHSSPYAWTQNGILNVTRPLLEFNISSISKGTIVKKAILSLYYASYGKLVSHSYDNNAFSVERITEKWDEYTVTWNNQPATTEVNKVIVPALEDTASVDIDVTALVQDMVNNPENSNGFMLKLLNEQPYRVALFASSDHSDVTKHPKLTIEF